MLYDATTLLDDQIAGLKAMAQLMRMPISARRDFDAIQDSHFGPSKPVVLSPISNHNRPANQNSCGSSSRRPRCDALSDSDGVDTAATVPQI